MVRKAYLKSFVILISLLLLLGSAAPGLQAKHTALAEGVDTAIKYLPIMLKNVPWNSPFGAESKLLITPGAPFMAWAYRMPFQYMRFNNRISWRQLQPNEGDPLQWNLLAGFEGEMRAMWAAHITPIVIINDYPAWATSEKAPGVPSYCGPLRADKLDSFAFFASQLASRYKAPQFNVHIWELGNEPDIDPSLVPQESELGCWGNAQDLEFYGGELYGEMVKVVGTAIKAADPFAQVWTGGLLLDSPNTTTPGHGRPEFFLKGILEAGVGTDYSYFDVVPYHAYSIYKDQEIDYDNGDAASPWFGDPWGGVMLGKAKFLRDIMTSYGVQKPLAVDEISLSCPDYSPFCTPPDDIFFQMQADHLVHVYARGLSSGISGFIWYTLESPGWRYGSLLDDTNTNPRPSYLAYQTLAHQLFNAHFLAPVDYGAGFEAYAFRRVDYDVHIVWLKEDLPAQSVLVPADKFYAAVAEDGTPIAPLLVGGNYQISVGFSPVYIIRKP